MSDKFGNCSGKTPAVVMDVSIQALMKNETDVKKLMEGICMTEFTFQEFGAAEEDKHHHLSFSTRVAQASAPTKDAPDARADKDCPAKCGGEKRAADAAAGVMDIVMTAEECKQVDTITVYCTKEPNEFHSINMKCGEKTFGGEAPQDMAKFFAKSTPLGDNGRLVGFQAWTSVNKEKTQHKIVGIRFLHMESPLPAFESEATAKAPIEKPSAKQTEEVKPKAETAAPTQQADPVQPAAEEQKVE